MRRVFVLIFILATLSLGGCYERNMAPELTYSQEKVDQINQEIDNFEWE